MRQIVRFSILQEEEFQVLKKQAEWLSRPTQGNKTIVL